MTTYLLVSTATAIVSCYIHSLYPLTVTLPVQLRQSRVTVTLFTPCIHSLSLYALLQHAELERLLRGHVAMRAAAANKAKGGGRGPVTRAGSKPKLSKVKHVPGPVSTCLF